MPPLVNYTAEHNFMSSVQAVDYLEMYARP